MEDVLDMSSENLALLKEEADMIEGDVIMRYIRIFFRFYPVSLNMHRRSVY